MSKFKYRVHLSWSEIDDCYVVELPEFANEVQRYFTHGDSYQETLDNAQAVLALLVESYQSEGRELPQLQSLQLA